MHIPEYGQKALCEVVWGHSYSLNSHHSSAHPVLQVPDGLWLSEQSSGILHFLLHSFVYILNFYNPLSLCSIATSFLLYETFSPLPAPISVGNSLLYADTYFAYCVAILLSTLEYNCPLACLHNQPMNLWKPGTTSYSFLAF